MSVCQILTGILNKNYFTLCIFPFEVPIFRISGRVVTVSSINFHVFKCLRFRNLRRVNQFPINHNSVAKLSIFNINIRKNCVIITTLFFILSFMLDSFYAVILHIIVSLCEIRTSTASFYVIFLGLLKNLMVPQITPQKNIYKISTNVYLSVFNHKVESLP